MYEISSGGTPSRKIHSYWENGIIPWLTTGELQNKVIYDTNEKITQEGLDNSSAKIYPKDSIVIAMYGMTVGYSAKLGIESSTNQACAVLYKKKVDIETDYVWYYIQSQAEALKALRHGTSQPNLNANDVANFEIIVPPISDQQRIVAQVEQYEAEIRKAQAIMNGCAARKKAILDKYLN